MAKAPQVNNTPNNKLATLNALLAQNKILGRTEFVKNANSTIELHYDADPRLGTEEARIEACAVYLDYTLGKNGDDLDNVDFGMDSYLKETAKPDLVKKHLKKAIDTGNDEAVLQAIADAGLGTTTLEQARAFVGMNAAAAAPAAKPDAPTNPVEALFDAVGKGDMQRFGEILAAHKMSPNDVFGMELDGVSLAQHAEESGTTKALTGYMQKAMVNTEAPAQKSTHAAAVQAGRGGKRQVGG